MVYVSFVYSFLDVSDALIPLLTSPIISRLHVPMQLLPVVYPFFHWLPEKLRRLMLVYSPISAARIFPNFDFAHP